MSDIFDIPWNLFSQKEDLKDGTQGCEADMFEALYTTKDTSRNVVLKSIFDIGYEGIKQVVQIHQKFPGEGFVEFIGTTCDNIDRFIVLEKMDTDLLNYITKTEVRIPNKIRIAAQIAKAIHVMNRQSFVHRDLKPENVLISSDGKIVKLCDFGFTKQKENNRTFVTTVGRNYTVNYAAPEILQGSFGYPSDVYSFGMVMLFILIGEAPYHGMYNSKYELENLILAGKLPQKQLDSLTSGLGRDIKEMVILKCIDPIHTNRPPFDEIYEYLQKLV